jgi:queuine tRNA-ribosyltransferase
MNRFKIEKKVGRARVGRLQTSHGEVLTPNFNPVGTLGTAKAVSPKDLQEIGVQMLLANTYHLMLRPGVEVVEKMGGLHKFMGWSGPIMTDSGGFQVFSLGVALEHGGSKVVRRNEDSDYEHEPRPRLNQITEEGVTFQSHIDGSKHFLSPEISMELQFRLGVDLIVAFDDHESSKHSYDQMKQSLELTERWGLRSLEALKRLGSEQMMYGVVHGGLHQDLRLRSAKFTDQHFEAVAIGGIYGRRQELRRQELYQLVDWVTSEISEEKPRHLLGIGEVEDIFEAVALGMDLFDCVAPTRRARNGSLYVSPKSQAYPSKKLLVSHNFTIAISQAKYTTDQSPIDPGCSCYTCQNFSRAYLRHLFMSKELLYHQLASIHNIFFMTNLTKIIRESLLEGNFKQLKNSWL